MLVSAAGSMSHCSWASFSALSGSGAPQHFRICLVNLTNNANTIFSTRTLGLLPRHPRTRWEIVKWAFGSVSPPHGPRILWADARFWPLYELASSVFLVLICPLSVAFVGDWATNLCLKAHDLHPTLLPCVCCTSFSICLVGVAQVDFSD